MRVEQHAYDQADMTVGLVSDSHGFVDPRIVDVLGHCDLILHAGDVMVSESLRGLQRICPVLAVAGNNDTAGADGLPHVITVQLVGGEIAVEHGHRFGFREPGLDKLKTNHPQARAIVYGHTHKMLVLQRELPWILNPGACGHTRNHGGPRCLVLVAQQSNWIVQEHLFAD